MGSPHVARPRTAVFGGGRCAVATVLGLGAVGAFTSGGPDRAARADGAATPSCGPQAPAEADRTTPPVISCSHGPARVLAGAAPTGWTDPGFDDARWAVASNLVIPRAAALPRGTASATAPDEPSSSSQRTAVDVAPGAGLSLRRGFDLATDARGRMLEAARVIELRVGYLDGFVAYLNGTEIARRNLPEGRPEGRPLLPHGHEIERVFVPVTAATPLRPQGNVIAVEVRPAVGRRGPESGAPAASVDVTVTSAARLVRGPYLIAPVDGTMTVAWETDLPASGTVELQAESTAVAARPAPVIRTGTHRPALRQTVRLSGLRAGAGYRYRVVVDDPSSGAPVGPWATSAWATFAAPPAASAALRFVVYGDMRAPGHAAHAQVVAGIVKERPGLVLCTGDLVAIGSEESAWQKYFEITAPLGAIAPVVPSFGNHEAYWHGSGLAKAWGLFGLPPAGPAPGYASFDWGGAHFVVLDTNHLDSAQRDWLARDLDAARKRHPRAIFAICHEGPWSHGVHGNSSAMQRELAPVLAAAGVDVLFSGHDHLYERGTGTTTHGALPYMVVGGGGAPLYEPTCQVSPAPGVASVAPALAPAAPSVPAAAPTAPRCPASVANIAKTYHYVVVEVNARTLRLCPKLPDGSPVEPCVETPLRHGHARLQ